MSNFKTKSQLEEFMAANLSTYIKQLEREQDHLKGRLRELALLVVDSQSWDGNNNKNWPTLYNFAKQMLQDYP